jgi:hypothetical protein
MAGPSVVYKSYTGLVETPKSGKLEMSDRSTLTGVYEGKITDAWTYALIHPRGLPITVNGFPCYVDSCTVDSDKGWRGIVTVVFCRTDILPPDEFSITPVEVNPAVERSAFFSDLTQADLEKAKQQFQAASLAGKTSIDGAIDAATNAVLIRKLINKWLRGNETFYLAGLKYQWTKVYSSLVGVTLRLGGYQAAPVSEYPGAPGTELLPYLGWLRQCDETSWNNGLFKVSRSWVWGPDGYWDPDIYGTTPM